MNDNDLTQRFHEALDDAAPDPLLWNRVESNVNRKTRNRRFAVLAAAAAVPASIAIAAVALTDNLPTPSPDVITVDDAPTEAATPSPEPTPEPPASTTTSAPVDLSSATLAYVDGSDIVVTDGSMDELVRLAVDDASGIDTIAGFVDASGRHHLAAIIATPDRDEVTEHSVRLFSEHPDGLVITDGPMFAQTLPDSQTRFSASFDQGTRELVILMHDQRTGATPVTTIGVLEEPMSVAGRDIDVPGGIARIDDVDTPLPMVVTSGGSAYSVAMGVDVQQPWTDQPVASLTHDVDTDVTHLLVRTASTEWSLRTVEAYGHRLDDRGRSDAPTPNAIDRAHPTDLQLLRGTFGTLYLRYEDRMWRYDDGSWTDLGSFSTTVTTFTADAELPRPASQVDEAGWTDAAIGLDSRLDLRGIGAIEAGMTAAEVTELTGQEWVFTDGFDGFCYYARLAGLEEVGFILTSDDPAARPEDAIVASVSSFADVDRPVLATDRGIAPGSSRADVIAAYGDLPSSPAPYDPEGEVLDLHGEGEDEGFGIRFVLDESGTVTHIRTGGSMRQATEGCA